MIGRSFLFFGLALILLYSCQESNRQQAKPTPPEEIVLYNKYCKGCHGKEGDLEFSGASNLKSSALSEEEIKTVILEGRGNMMPYNKVLTERHVAVLTDYIISLRKIN